MRIKFFAILSCFLFILSSSRAQNSWELRRNENGISIYSRRSVDGKLVELRLLCQFEATADELIRELYDINNYTTWVYGNKRSGVIKKFNDYRLIYFTETQLPWPLENRDLVTELSLKPATANTPLIIQAKSVDGILPPKKHFIRVPYSLVTWRITPVNGNKLNIDYTFSLDPGGSVPTWLVNLTIANGPFKSFKQLGEMLKADKKALSTRIN